MSDVVDHPNLTAARQEKLSIIIIIVFPYYHLINTKFNYLNLKLYYAASPP